MLPNGGCSGTRSVYSGAGAPAAGASAKELIMSETDACTVFGDSALACGH